MNQPTSDRWTPSSCVPHCKCQGDEWEEKWGERYGSAGWANKYADKWAKDGPNVWHERWGEDYDGSGGCVKYTDKARRSQSPVMRQLETALLHLTR